MPDNVVNLNSLDPAGFRIPASDAKGHSVPKRVRVQPGLANAMKILAGCKAFPYKDEAELMRHAFVRHVKWLESLGDVPSVSGIVDAANEVLIQEQMHEEYLEIFTSLRTRINYYIQRGDHTEARKLVGRMSSDFKKMPDGYWKTQYERQLKEWDWLFENVPKVNLVNLPTG